MRQDPFDKNLATTYSPTIGSTIGATGLNFSVRNGKRWTPCAKITKKLVVADGLGLDRKIDRPLPMT